jgi:hypothetical protein
MKARSHLPAVFTCVAILFLASCNRVRGTQATSRNEGYVFSQPVPILEQLGIPHSTSARLGTRVSGEVYLLTAYGSDNRLGLVMSHNEGDTYMAPIPISGPDARITLHGEASPSFAMGDTELYSLWEQTDSRGSDQLLVARAVPWGHGFEKPVNVVKKDRPSFNGFSSMAIAPNGDLYVVWLDGRDPQPPVPGSLVPDGTFSVYIARSTDQGMTFGPNVRVTLGACPCCRPTLAFGAHGEIFVAWRKVFPGDIRDMVVATSPDQGKTFMHPVRIAFDNWKLAGCPDSGPALATHGNRLYAVWMSEGNKPGIRLAYSDDGAKTFTKPIIASADVIYPNHPSLSIADDGTVLLAFQGRDTKTNEGWGDVAVYLAELRKTGMTQPFKMPGIQGSASYPQVLSGGTGRLYIAWTETTDSATRVVLSRGRGTPASN